MVFFAEAFAHRNSYTQTLFHTESFYTHTHKALFTHARARKAILTQRGLYTQRLDTQKPLNREARTLYTQTLLHTNTQKVSDTGAFTHRRF